MRALEVYQSQIVIYNILLDTLENLFEDRASRDAERA
jgi:hypothetical protein